LVGWVVIWTRKESSEGEPSHFRTRFHLRRYLAQGLVLKVS